jgi:hypothetical protein
MKCPKCNSEHNELKKLSTGPHSEGLYCKDCGRWLKWMPKPTKSSSYTDNTTWQPPEEGYSRPIFGRRHIR